MNDKELALKYRPLLILFPEICNDSNCKDHPKPNGPGHLPLGHDYHPRDIQLVLDSACRPLINEYSWTIRIKEHSRTIRIKADLWIIRIIKNQFYKVYKKPLLQEKLLDVMSENNIDYIDLIDRRGPKHVDTFRHVYDTQIHSKDNNAEGESKYKKKAYARVIRGSEQYKDYISIQYWLAYFFDEWTNVHEMDWEMVSVILRIVDPVVEPIACIFNAHRGGFRKPWKYVHKADDDENKNPKGTHPIAYIAFGSHAAYYSDDPPYVNVAEFHIGDALKKMIRATGIGQQYLLDEVPSFNTGEKIFPDVAVIPEPKEGKWFDEWRWLNFQGRWGSPVQMSFMERRIADIPAIGGVISKIPRLFERPIRERGPTGPNAKGRCWNRPFDWIIVDCVDAPVTRNWIANL